MAKRSTAAPASRRPANQSPQPATQRLRTVAGYFSDSEAGDDRLVYERIRLGILSALSVNNSMTFAELKDLLKTSDGNLSTHARKLEDAGYIACKKQFSERVPKTEYSMTARGRRVFERHLDHMEALINAARGK
ncbi:MAG TPA: transcriptional regulator [Woeseiaceae bacterium]|nr:transcriptional regulator [Woeseiaceae bacterium]